jgi:hypothetical protein
MGSCNGFLDYQEEDWFTEENIFEEPERTKRFLFGIYSFLPQGFNDVEGSMRASGADDAEEADERARIQIMNDGRWSPTQIIDPEWQSLYNGIRQANIFLKNYNPVNFQYLENNNNYFEIVKELKTFEEEARFLRSFYYYELLKRYGSVPYLNGNVLELEEVNSLTPNSLEEISSFIVAEMDAILADLPVDYSDVPGAILGDSDVGGLEANNGRITKGAAMALKADVLLLAASPLHGESMEEWAAAARASYAIIDSGWYDLESDYEDIFNDSESSELIWGKRERESNSFERSNFPVGFEGANPGTTPTQNLVDTYEMINGMDIDEPGSGYDPNNPYVDRDERFYATILYNNAEWKNRNIQVYRNGTDGPPQEFATETGYYLRKFVEENVNIDPNNTTSTRHVWIYYRLGEMYLNFAEAMNEAYGPNSDPQGFGMTAVDALNVIRNRAGLPDYAGPVTKDAIRTEIHDERRVELAFENKRFWDIRRWDIGDQTTDIYAMNVIFNQDSTFSYNKVLLENRVWESNFYPIPQSELFKNPNLVQTPGWTLN